MRRELRSKARLARRVRKELLKAAARGGTITYGRLMQKFRLSRGVKLSSMIGMVDRNESDSGAPGFAAIIVRKDTGYPGGGYFCDDALPPRLRRPARRGNDPRLSELEKGHIRRQRETIWVYYSPARREVLK